MGFPVVYHPDYVTPIPQEHRFPMPKFKLLYEMLLRDQVITPEQVYAPEFPTQACLELVHDRQYITAYRTGTLDQKAQRKIGLPWSAGVVNRTLTAIGGTIATAKLALEHGLACNTAGGTHHAFPDYGSGFCILNDLAIAARTVRHEGLAKKILILDLDVHQGDGTAFIFRDEPDVFTFSMHCDVNFPSKKQTSDFDIPLPAGLDDDGYLQILAEHLEDLLTQVQPDLIFYDAGVDTHVGDRLGKLAMTDRGIYRRERMVLGTCRAAGYPVACVIGGGYAKNIDDLVYRHSLLHRAAKDIGHFS